MHEHERERDFDQSQPTGEAFAKWPALRRTQAARIG